MAQTPTKDKDFGLDHLISVSMLPAQRAALLAVRIQRIVVPGFARALGAVKSIEDAKAGRLDFGEVGQGLAVLSANLTDAEFTALSGVLLELTFYNGKPIKPVIDTLCQGKVGLYFRILWFALEVNFGNFSEGLGALIGPFLERFAPSSETSPRESEPPGLAGV